MALSNTDIDTVARLLAKEAGMSFDPSKAYLIESRMAQLGRDLNIGDASDVVHALRRGTDPLLAGSVIEAMTTNETSFFRDPHIFDAFGGTVLSQIASRGGSKSINIWSAASSSGQEAYTLAMILHEKLPDVASWRIRILASDISAEMVKRTKEATYSQLEVNRGLPASMLLRYFERQARNWQVVAPLRKLVEPKHGNLAKPWAVMPPLDVVFLRNVLIYFDPQTRRSVLERIAKAMRPDGVLFMGTAETPLTLTDAFERVVIGKASYFKLRQSSSTAPAAGVSTRRVQALAL